jgi:hypothetical protein
MAKADISNERLISKVLLIFIYEQHAVYSETTRCGEG